MLLQELSKIFCKITLQILWYYTNIILIMDLYIVNAAYWRNASWTNGIGRQRQHCVFTHSNEECE